VIIDQYSSNEPNIEDLLQDPIFHALLARDGLTIDDVKKVINDYQSTQPAQQQITH
jgi:hypothetical protein